MTRILRILGGFTLVIAGIFMLFLPGPGIITILGGLALLSRDLHWAGRLAEWVRRRFGDYAGEDPDTLTGAAEVDSA